MSNTVPRLYDRLLNLVLIGLLVLVASGYLSAVSIYGAMLALISAGVAVGVFLQQRWAYFASAVWGLAGYQLAKEGLDFEWVKRSVMISGIVIVALSIYLHERLGRRRA
ncbi:hypothetical protein [Marinimicrobium alkaliphilum]|uniref:hypothetical protein n=1 Tax=Marinimicrobium alkaliphilum TaxID=2202654 RepID=UPI000DBABF4C|nr:hypothetical protein [Marinimicrobium alkaliphilum]